MYKILIVEDDKTIATELKKFIAKWNYEVYIANEFKNIINEFTEFKPDLVLLDIKLPYYNGYYWCTEIRRISTVPIIFISSVTENMNIIMAINMGGDDFITKPFDLDVLMAKITALIRRSYDFTSESNFLEHKEVILNINDNIVSYNNNTIELSKNEFRILKILMHNKDKIVKREDIMLELWETDNYVDENTLTVNVSRLREKLSLIGIKNFIKTKKGEGYMI